MAGKRCLDGDSRMCQLPRTDKITDGMIVVKAQDWGETAARVQGFVHSQDIF